ncbi:hypothetical protein KFK09_025138 [Dendrobium nobile]|uniref:Uncharacterized protein n=1 Tax=Dendrobium nobile TaxID=94219 RepID=A0A8T3AGW5_DENNO|nr:hypothetical protein KFK09_025138 [Dendrobium nobile]
MIRSSCSFNHSLSAKDPLDSVGFSDDLCNIYIYMVQIPANQESSENKSSPVFLGQCYVQLCWFNSYLAVAGRQCWAFLFDYW